MNQPVNLRARSSYETEGWTVFRNVLRPSLRISAVNWLYAAAARAGDDAALEAEFEPEMPERPLSVRKLRRLLWNDAPFWTGWLLESGIFELGSSFITREPAVVFHAAFFKPGTIGSKVAFHQDQALWDNDYPEAVSVWIALSDSTERNGCMQLCPGSHRRELIPHRSDTQYPWHPYLDPVRDDLPAPKRIPMAQGDVLIWHRYLVHGSDPNVASEDRLGMVVVFANGASSSFKAKDVWRIENSRTRDIASIAG